MAFDKNKQTYKTNSINTQETEPVVPPTRNSASETLENLDSSNPIAAINKPSTIPSCVTESADESEKGWKPINE